MKKSLLALLLAVALVAPVFAAEKNMWVGGSFGYSSVNNDYGWGTTSSTSWSVEPEFGYSLNEKWDIGLDFSYSSGIQTGVFGVDYGMMDGYPTPGQWSMDTKTTGIAPFVRYHIAQIAGIDVMLKASLIYAKADADAGGYTYKFSAYGISVAPIISYSINETWSIGAKLNFAELAFLHAGFDQDGWAVKNDAFGFNLNDGSLVNIGFSYHF